MANSVIDFNPQKTSDIQEHQIGYRYVDDNGDIYRYAKAGASNISRGKLQLAPTPKTNHDNMATATAAIGAKTVTVTLGATAATANEYADGYLEVNAGTGAGLRLKISGHPAANSGATLEVTLRRPLTVALAVADTKTCLVHNDHNGTVEGTSSTSTPAGFPLVNTIAANFYWALTRGHVGALADETLTLGALLTAGTSTAGAVEEYDDDSTPDTDNIVGFASTAGVDTEYRDIKVTID